MVFMTMGFSHEENGFEEKREQHEREREREEMREGRERKKVTTILGFLCV